MKKYIITSILSAYAITTFCNEEPVHYNLEELQYKAADIRAILYKHSCVNQCYIDHLDTIINQITSASPSPSLIINSKLALKRLESFARIAEKDPHGASKDFKKMSNLFAQRDQIVSAIEAVATPCVLANLVMYNPADYIGRTPTPLEQKKLAEEKNILLLSNNKKLDQLNAALFKVEQEILQDQRSIIEKYGPLSFYLGISLATVILLAKGINRLAS